MMKKLLVAYFLMTFLHGYGQLPRVEIPGSEVRKITSSIVAGQEYELHISLPAGYTLQTKVLENTGHSGSKSETFSRGLQYVFERPSLHFGTDLLHKYTGSYEFPGGYKIEIKTEHDQLALYYDGTNKSMLFAASDTYFYSTTEFLNVYFEKDNDHVQGLTMKRCGNIQLLNKVQ
ncbi:MAG: DUF3471 domain-containing protein [Ginsengibacter sp.]